MCALHLRGVKLSLDVGGMDTGMVAALRGVIDTGARNSDSAAHTARAKGYVRATHPDAQARSRLGNVHREPGKNPHPPIKSEVAQRVPPQRCEPPQIEI